MQESSKSYQLINRTTSTNKAAGQLSLNGPQHCMQDVQEPELPCIMMCTACQRAHACRLLSAVHCDDISDVITCIQF